ncbi:MAG: hypothetical protein V3V67_09825 [Myxococcota bacterium]
MPPLVLRAMLSLALLATCVGGAPRSAAADPSQLCRGASSVLLAPTDLVLAPYIAGRDAYHALSIPGEPFKVWISWLPSYPLFIAIQAGGTVLRVVAGAFEILPGMVALALDEAAAPLFAQQDQAPQLLSSELGPCPIRVGTSYWSILAGVE